ncbi:MAG: 5-(carboxyamino)imidazole ribonucleotide synthase [Hyphomonadaceae bacterium]|nr:5-(carboxyamino)imidazole ribonucleotide synthase [Hyphomonadaceae bacterium]
MSALKAGATIGILGGGQLGRMLGGAAATLGFDVSIYCPEKDCPASRVASQHCIAEYTDIDALLGWAATCDAITYEFENVPVEAARALIEAGHLVRPGAKPLEVSQDRLVEKSFLRACGIATADFAEVNVAMDIAEPIKAFGGQGILKTRRDGYDGKGQARLEAGDDYEAAHKALKHAPCILEAMVPFEREVSIIIARDRNGEAICFDVPRNEHVNGILKRSVVPSGLSDEVALRAAESAKSLAAALDYVGVLALEFFVLEDGTLLANEFAPRVHNSGHWTPEACATGQFEQHMRAVAGWPLGPVTRFHDVEMLNLLGEEALVPPEVLAADGVLTLYGKRDAKPGRKMGHLVRRRP